MSREEWRIPLYYLHFPETDRANDSSRCCRVSFGYQRAVHARAVASTPHDVQLCDVNSGYPALSRTVCGNTSETYASTVLHLCVSDALQDAITYLLQTVEGIALSPATPAPLRSRRSDR